MSDPLSYFTRMPINELEENAYALQIDYDPPLRESDRDDILREIKWIVDNQEKFYKEEVIEDIRNNRKADRQRKGRWCMQEQSLVSNTDLLLLADHQLIFYPVSNGYQCFTRNEVKKLILKDGINPYTGLRFSQKEIKILRDQLKNRPYPNIEVYDIVSEIRDRIENINLSAGRKNYEYYLDRLISVAKRLFGPTFDINVLHKFAEKPNHKQYNLFLSHKDFKKELAIMDRDKASTKTLKYILDRYNRLKQDDDPDADKFIMTILSAIDEFVYMYENNLTYTELLYAKGETNHNIVELNWRPNLLVEKYYNHHNKLKERYTVNENGIKDGFYESFYLNGNKKVSEANYINGKLDGEYIEDYDTGYAKIIANYNMGVLNGVYETFFIDPPGELASEMTYLNGKLNGKYIEYDNETGDIVKEVIYVNGEEAY